MITFGCFAVVVIVAAICFLVGTVVGQREAADAVVCDASAFWWKRALIHAEARKKAKEVGFKRLAG